MFPTSGERMVRRSNKAKPAKKRIRNEPPAETIRTYFAFRRALHSKGKLLDGLQDARIRLVPSVVPSIVKSAATKTLYRNVLARNPFPNSIGKLKQKAPLERGSDRVEAAWAASILSLFVDQLKTYVQYRDHYYGAGKKRSIFRAIQSNIFATT